MPATLLLHATHPLRILTQRSRERTPTCVLNPVVRKPTWCHAWCAGWSWCVQHAFHAPHCRVFASMCASAAWRVRCVHTHPPACMHSTLSTRRNRPSVMLSETMPDKRAVRTYGSGYGVAVREIALQGGAAGGSRSRPGAAGGIAVAPRAPQLTDSSTSFNNCSSQIRSLNPAFPCIAFRIKASPSSPIQGLYWRLHSVNAPVTTACDRSEARRIASGGLRNL